jgi:hypothetical protein
MHHLPSTHFGLECSRHLLLLLLLLNSLMLWDWLLWLMLMMLLLEQQLRRCRAWIHARA